MACVFYVYGWCDFLVLEIRIQTCHSNRQKIVSESGNKQRGFLLKCLFSSRYNFRFLINVSFLEKDLIKGTFQTTNIHKYMQHIACINPILHYRKHCLYTKGAHQHKTQLTLKKIHAEPQRPNGGHSSSGKTQQIKCKRACRKNTRMLVVHATSVESYML